MQATVTDLPHPKVNGSDSSVLSYQPALGSAYDYYPFGMLMPGRYVSDTGGSCLTLNRTRWIKKEVDSCYDVYRWIWPLYEWKLSATATIESP